MKKLYLFIFAQILSFCAFALPPTQDDKMPQEILRYVNQYRAQYHLPPLKMESRISHEAQIHSQEMATHKLPFGHDGFFKRIKRLYAQFSNCQGGSENVAFNYKNAKHVVSSWMTSSGHKKNILGHFNRTGVGIARDSHGKLYFTQIFLKSEA